MDHRAVFKALGDDTRFALYLELLTSPFPLSTADLASRLDLHPNTVRPHLERMRDVGLLEVDSGSHGTVGRPQHLYRAVADAPGMALERAPYVGLAGLLATLAARGGARGEDAAAVGREEGRRVAVRTRRRPGEAVTCAQAVAAAMSGLGFDAAVEEDGCTMRFATCPFRSLAEEHPDLVCGLHRGMTEGLAELLGEGVVDEFATLADPRPCRARVSVR